MFIKKIMLLGSGELGKEFVIAAKRLGQHVIAVDSYNNAPAQQLADEREVINMLDGEALDKIVDKYKPDIIVPEIEAIRTERFYDYEDKGIQVVPSARAANYTMNRKSIRELASRELGLKTAPYRYASSCEELESAVSVTGIPCVVKPLMSSSGKGQYVIKSQSEIMKAWEYSTTQGRGDYNEVIAEGFINFHTEITLLTVTQRNGNTLFCPPIGHHQERGDYQESWQPCEVKEDELIQMKKTAAMITSALTGYGIWGVEFFLSDDGVYFSELSPRPHDTGMVTLAGTQNFNEFELHLRAVLGYEISEITHERNAASAVILAESDSKEMPDYTGVDEVLSTSNSDLRIFGKPSTRRYRRMGVVLSWGDKSATTDELRIKAKSLASKIKVK